MKIIKIISKFKNTFFWHIILTKLIHPFYKIIWLNLINSEGKYLFLEFKKENEKDHIINIDEDKPCVIIKNDKTFFDFANKISKQVDHNLILKKIEDQNKNYQKLENNNYFFSIYEDLNIGTQKEIVEFAKSKRNLSIAANYLGVMPTISKISLYVNFPKDYQKERAAMMWHKDDFGFKSLDFFMPICKLDNDNGAMQFLDKKNKLGVFERVPEHIEDALPKERNKIKTVDFEKYFDEKKIRSFIGDLGDALLIDSFRIYHRGGKCKKNYRIMFRISYQTPDSSRVLSHNIDNKFEYLKTLKKSDMSSKLDKYIFFGNEKYRNKKKFINFLLLFYRLMHVKLKKIT